MPQLVLSLVLALCCVASCLDIAIVGAGIGGSSAAHFARRVLGSDTHITVYERDGRYGGRVHDVTIGGLRVEAGASIYHKVNKYIGEFAKEFNITTAVAGGGRMAIWNGKEFVFEESDYSFITIAKLLWRYHLSPVKLRALTDDVLIHWQRIYNLFENSKSFDTVEEWLDTVNLTELIHTDLRSYLLREGCSEAFVDELITAVTRVQYGQDATLHALVGLVSLVGAEDGNLLYIPGGNDQLAKALLDDSKAEVLLNTPVRKIEKFGCRYRVNDGSEYDAVLIATPLEGAGIVFESFNYDFVLPIPREFRTTHTSFIVSDGINPAYFAPAELTATDILTTEGIVFNSIALKGKTENGKHVHKIFSRAPIDKEIPAIFVNGSIAATFPWPAYPLLTPFTDSAIPPSFVLAPSLLYLNAFESAISCMETSALSARNAVNWLAKASLPS